MSDVKFYQQTIIWDGEKVYLGEKTITFSDIWAVASAMNKSGIEYFPDMFGSPCYIEDREHVAPDGTIEAKVYSAHGYTARDLRLIAKNLAM